MRAHLRHSADGDAPDAPFSQNGFESIALVALENQRLAFNGSTTPQRLFEFPEPKIEFFGLKPQLLDEGGFSPAAPFALVTNDRSEHSS